MKKITALFTIALLAFTASFAQVLPNAGFETWTHNTFPSYDTPDGWNTLNPTTGLLGVITCYKAATLDIHGGTYALKLITKSVAGQTANGVATTGTINTTSQTIGGGVSYSSRPDSIVGFYKYTPVQNDNGFVELQLLGVGGDTDTIGYARFKTPNATVGAYTRFAKAITYRSANAVSKSIWIISSSADAVTHHVNSTLFIDDLQLITNATTVAEQQKMDLTVGPNPASNMVFVRNPLFTKATFLMYDVIGRNVLFQSVANSVNSIDVSAFPMGLYIYSIVDENNNVIKTAKLIVQKK